MELILTEEQRLLQESVAGVLAQAGGVKRARALRGKADGFDRAMLARMGDEGWLGLMVPPERGGLGLGLTELGLVLMEMGKVLAPEPVAASAVSAAFLAADPGGSAGNVALEQLIAGRALVIPAIAGPVAQSARNGASLDGVCQNVPLAIGCNAFLVAAESADGPILACVPREAPGMKIAERQTVDGRPFARLTLAGVPIGGNGANVIGNRDAARRLHDTLLFAAAAELVGVMSAALDITVEYLKTRKQFGKAIGSFQSLQHRAVDDFARIVSARSFLFQVAAQGPDIGSAMASALKSYVGGEALAVTKSAIQMHGGIGFTEDCDVGLYLKRAMWLSAWLGNEAEHRQRYAALMG